MSELTRSAPAVLGTTGTPFRLSPVAGVLAARSDHTAESARAAGWAAGWAAGARAAAESAAAHRKTVDDAARAAERARATQVAAALQLLRTATATLTARTAPVLAAAVAALDDGAATLAQAVLGRELSAADDRARAALARALSLPPEVGVHTVHLNPSDLAVLLVALAATHVDGDAAATAVVVPDGVTLVGDASLALGDAMSEYPDGYLDARIGTAVERARLALSAGAR